MGGRTWSGVGKTAIVTGPTGTGIGLHTSRWLAERGTFVILAGRNEDRLKECEKAIRAVAKDADGKPNGDQIQIQSIQCDTSSLESCDKFVEEFEKLDRNLDLLISNAGIMAPPLTVTKDGFESQIGTNHVGHHYLAQKLLPRLKAAAPSRVVLVASMGHKLAAKWDPKDFSAVFHPTPKQYGVWSHYGNSKLANVLEARAFNKRYQAEGITAYSLHPGVVATELGRNNGPSAFFYKSEFQS
jgi:retinol dehydrogenase-12